MSGLIGAAAGLGSEIVAVLYILALIAGSACLASAVIAGVMFLVARRNAPTHLVILPPAVGDDTLAMVGEDIDAEWQRINGGDSA